MLNKIVFNYVISEIIQKVRVSVGLSELTLVHDVTARTSKR